MPEKNVQQVKAYSLLGNLTDANESELSDTDLASELERIEAIMAKHNIVLDREIEYEPRTIYKFITEELFQHESDDLQFPGMMKTFIYEEFHPYHLLDIERRTQDFMEDWFNRRFGEYSWELNESFLLSDGTKLSKTEVI